MIKEKNRRNEKEQTRVESSQNDMKNKEEFSKLLGCYGNECKSSPNIHVYRNPVPNVTCYEMNNDEMYIIKIYARTQTNRKRKRRRRKNEHPKFKQVLKVLLKRYNA